MGKKPRHAAAAAQRRVLRPRSQQQQQHREADRRQPEAEAEAELLEPEVAEEEAEPEPEPEEDPANVESLNLVSSCPHVNRNVKVEQLQQALGSTRPPHSCSGCSSKEGKKQTVKRIHKQAGPGHHRKSYLWICLACAHIGCGLLEGDKPRFLGHAPDHSRRCRHQLALRLAGSTSTWCFECNKYIIRGCTVAQGFGTSPKAQLLQQAVELVQEHLSRTDLSRPVNRTEAAAAAKSQNGTSRSLRGLVNLGNTCFFNSVMQNLLALKRLQQHFLVVEEQPATEGRLTSALRSFFQEVNAAGQSELEGLPAVTTRRRLRDQGSVNPKVLFSAVCGKASRFKSFQQQDSHELLRCLLDGLQVEEEESRVNTSGDSAGQQTFVERLFGGQFASTVTCCECGHSSSVLEPFLDLSLPIPSAAKPVTTKQSAKKEAKLRKGGRKRVKEATTSSISSPATSTLAKACNSVPPADADDTSWLDFVGDDYVNVQKPADLEEDEAATSSSAQQPNTGWEMVQDEGVDGLASLFGAAEEEADAAACSPAGIDTKEVQEEEEEVPDIVEEAILPMTLAGCLSAFTRPEVLSGENAWECAKCSFREQQEEEEEEGEEQEDELHKEIVKRNATKSVAIKQAPQVLTVHLKRFAQDIRGRLSKLTGHVAFEELLNLGHFQDRGEGPCLYRLVGVVEHLGTMRGGHYVAYVRGDEQCWYYVSDSDVRRATLDQVLRTEAYLLFYERL